MNTKRYKFALAAILTFVSASTTSAAPLGFEWISKDSSFLHVNLSPFGEFYWRNPDGSEIRLTGGLFGASLTLKDRKDKRGRIFVEPGAILSLSDSSYGTSGEPAIAVGGTTESGSGDFVLAFEGFQEIKDQEVAFNADLVGRPEQNPLDLELYGQGNQLVDGKDGQVSFLTRWSSDEVIPLLDDTGAEVTSLGIGDFLLESLGNMTAFEFSLDVLSPSQLNFDALFTADQTYTFVNDATIADPFLFSNLRPSSFDGVFGEVTKEVSLVPVPAALPALISAFAMLGLFGARRRFVA